jgi:hypothetical protein
VAGTMCNSGLPGVKTEVCMDCGIESGGGRDIMLDDGPRDSERTRRRSTYVSIVWGGDILDARCLP